MRYHLSWRRNGDSLDVGLAVNRWLASGGAAWWCPRGTRGVEEGDYLLEGPAALGPRLAAMGLVAAERPGGIPRGARRLPPPRVRLLAGQASAYPYFAYYALCLLRLGVDYGPVGGPEIAAGALEGADLLVLPGGFALWGLDRAEGAAGADAAVRRFLGEGGACLGSCGGAYYLSAGRPAWTGTAWARPRYTHEYLQSGAGILSVRLARGPLACGVPASVELPYYHGPIYGLVGRETTVAGRFEGLVLPSRLAIDNPLEARRFQAEMAGRPAILTAAGPRGRAVLFSPHPEMGDLLRKYIALDGYIRRYLPIRGRRRLAESLAAYRPLEAPAFRLVLNGIHALTADGPARPAGIGPPARPVRGQAGALERFRRRAAARLRGVRRPAGEYGRVVQQVADGLRVRLGPAAAALEARLRLAGRSPAPPTRGAVEAWGHLVAEGTRALAAGERPASPVAERLMQVELAICLMEATSKILRADGILRGGERTG